MELVLEEDDAMITKMQEDVAELEQNRQEALDSDAEIQAGIEHAEQRLESELQYMKKHWDSDAPMLNPKHRRQHMRVTAKQAIASTGVVNRPSGPMTRVNPETPLTEEERIANRKSFIIKRDMLLNQQSKRLAKNCLITQSPAPKKTTKRTKHARK